MLTGDDPETVEGVLEQVKVAYLVTVISQHVERLETLLVVSLALKEKFEIKTEIGELIEHDSPYRVTDSRGLRMAHMLAIEHTDL
jgi:hypothetical protein